MSNLKIGDRAPDFTLATDQGKDFSLSSQIGRKVVLFFYAQDDTEGCTVENMEFTQHMGAFKAIGTEVVGISPDSVEDHGKFRKKYRLGILLGADPEHRAIEPFGVWGPKKLFGRDYIGLIRTSFLIDAEGRIAGIFPAKVIKGHAAKVLAAATALAG